LTVIPGDEITVTDEKSDGWAKGVLRRNGKSGWFPLSFTEEMPPDTTQPQSTPMQAQSQSSQAVQAQPTKLPTSAAASTPTAAPAPPAAAKQLGGSDSWKEASIVSLDSSESSIVCCCTAVYKYSATQESELSLEVGDVIWILEKSNDIWWKARNYYGIVGYAPVSYLQEETDSQPTSVKANMDTLPPPLSMRVQSSQQQSQQQKQQQQTQAPKLPAKGDALSGMPWYFSSMTRDQSETALMGKGVVGMFLVRNSTTHNTLSVNIGRHVEHFKISFDNQWNVYNFGERRFDSIQAIIDWYTKNAIFTLADKTQILLTRPYVK
jgi:hypothetical protein